MEEKEKVFELTKENYHSPEARKHYLGSSMFKDFKKCEVMALAKVNGEYEEKTSEAMLFGSYVDAHFSNELPEFIAAHPELFTKQGTLLAKYKDVDEVIKAIENDPVFMKYMSGEKQVIMTGTIANVPFKIKIDSYHPNKVIVDQKVMKDLDPVWVNVDGKNVLMDFVEAYGYDIQGAIYQEVVKENCGEQLPFVLAVATKEECPDKLVFRMDQEYLDLALAEVKEKAPRYWDIINGKIEPVGCGRCPVCRAKKKLDERIPTYKRIFKEKE